ncbi:hypothetical protein JNUCC23_21170 [Peribacillus sp. JNUCC 23]
MVKKRILALLGYSFLSIMMLAGCATNDNNNPAPEKDNVPMDNNVNEPGNDVAPDLDKDINQKENNLKNDVKDGVDNNDLNGTDTNINGDTNMNGTHKHEDNK